MLLFVTLPAVVASAHSAIEPRSVEAGTPTEFTLTIPHGCAPGEPPPEPGETVSATNDVSMRLPESAREVTADAPDGWDVESEITDRRWVTTWTGGEVAPDELGEFTFTATLYGDAGEQLAFEVFQGCVEGSYRWIQVDEEDAAEGEPLDQPAPLVELETSAVAPTPEPAVGAPTPDDAAPDATPEPSPEATGEPAVEDTEGGTETALSTSTPTPAAESTPDATPTESTTAVDGDGASTGVIAAVLVIALGMVGVAAVRRNSS